MTTRTHLYGAAVRSAGADGNGTTDDLAVFNLSILDGAVYVYPGTYKLGINTTPVMLDESAQLVGEGAGSILKPTSTTASGTQIAFEITAVSALIDNLAIDFDLQASSTTVGVSWKADNLTLRDLSVDGNTTQAAGVRSHVAQLVYPSSTGAQNGLVMEGLDVTGMSYSFLKANADTSDQTRIKVLGGHYHANYAVDLAFNSPASGSSIEDVLVLGGSFFDNKGAEVTGGSSHRMTAAGYVKGFRFALNHASGQGEELARVEENAVLGVIGLNTSDQSAGSECGIEITDNDIGGTTATPSLLLLLGNALRGSTASTRYGISLVSDAGADPLHDSVIASNLLHQWESGLRTATGVERVLGIGNAVVDCTNGIKSVEPALSFTENMIVDATNQFSADRGGLFGRIHFRQSNTAAPTLTSMLDGSAVCIGVNGWTYETARFDITSAATTDVSMMPLGLMMNGTMTLALYTNSPTPGYAVHRATVDWDGATLTVTDLQRKTSGSVVISDANTLVNSSGNLAFRIDNSTGTAVSGVRVQVAFDGVHLWD